MAVIDPFALDEPSSEADSDSDGLPLGRLDAVREMEAGGLGAFLAIGTGAGSSGMFGQRDARGRRRAVMRGDATDASESAVEAALRWFKRHQGADGWWDGSGHLWSCVHRREPPWTQPDPARIDPETIAYTAFALLCFFGAGYDQLTPGPYTDAIAHGLTALRSVQLPDGTISANNYAQGIAALTLVEAYAMSHDPGLLDPAKRGIHIVLSQQNHQPGECSGWDYAGPSDRDDTSVTGWNVMALVCADGAGIRVDKGLNEASEWLRRGLLHLYDEHFPYAIGTRTECGNATMDGVAVACAAFLGARIEREVFTLADAITANRPTTFPCCSYALYYDTVALFHIGDERWNGWRGRVRDLLVQAQQRGNGCLGGSWPRGHGLGETAFLSTALCCLTLEVPYRYAKSHHPHRRR